MAKQRWQEECSVQTVVELNEEEIEFVIYKKFLRLILWKWMKISLRDYKIHFYGKRINHIVKKLADGKEKADLRLVYLALAHIVKFRGHFLIEGNIDIENNDIQQLFDEFLAFYSAYFEDSSVLEKKMEVREILTEKLSKLAKKDKIVQTYAIDKKSPINKFLELIVGKKSNFQIIFELEEEAALQFSKL